MNASETKHTPGPWKLCPNVDETFYGIYPDTGKMEFPIAYFSKYVKAEINDANGRLIAAAPDMLAALKRAHETLVVLGDLPSMSADLAAAIAKAEGRSS